MTASQAVDIRVCTRSHALRLVAFKLHRSDNVVACIENLDRVCVLIFEILFILVALYVTQQQQRTNVTATWY